MSLPPELDFVRDRAASPQRMNRAMEYIQRRFAGVEAARPDVEAAVEELRAVGLQRVTAALAPILADAAAAGVEVAALREQLHQDGVTALVIDAVLAVVYTRAAADAQFAPRAHGHTIGDIAGLGVELLGKLSAATMGVAGGVATLGPNGKVPAMQLPAPPVTSVNGQTGVVSIPAPTVTAVNGQVGNVELSFVDEPQNRRETGNYVLALTDRGGHVYWANPVADQTIRVPSNATTPFPIGSRVSIVVSHAAAGVRVVSDDTLISQGVVVSVHLYVPAGEQLTLLKVEPTVWRASF